LGFGRALTSEEHEVFNNMEVAAQEGELFIIDYDGTMNPDENAPSNRVNHASVVALRAMTVFDVNALIITGNGRGTVGDAVSHALGEAFSNYSDELLDRSLYGQSTGDEDEAYRNTISDFRCHSPDGKTVLLDNASSNTEDFEEEVARLNQTNFYVIDPESSDDGLTFGEWANA